MIQQTFGRRWGWLGVAAVLTIMAGWGASDFEIGGTATLFDTRNPGERRAAAMADRFTAGGRQVVVVFDAGEEGRHDADAKQAAEALGRALREEMASSPGQLGITSVTWGIDTRSVSPRMLLVQPTATVREAVEGLEQLGPLLESETSAEMLQRGIGSAIGVMLQTATQQKSDNLGFPGSEIAAPGSDNPPQTQLETGAAVFEVLMDMMTERLSSSREKVERHAAGWGGEEKTYGWFGRLRNVVEEKPWQWLAQGGGGCCFWWSRSAMRRSRERRALPPIKAQV